MSRNLFGPNLLAVAVVTALGLLFSVADLSAQGTRRKRNPPTPTRNVPVVQQSEPQVVSRAEDFPDTGTQPLLTTQLPKADQPVNTTDENSKTIEELKSRIQSLETGKKADTDEKHKRLLLNLDILSKAEQRSESLRKQLFEMIERESAIKTKLDLIEVDVRPESIERSVAFAGSLRPEELRSIRKKNLEVERTNLQALLVEIQRTKASLDLNVQKADILVDKLRAKLEKQIDDALIDDPEKP